MTTVRPDDSAVRVLVAASAENGTSAELVACWQGLGIAAELAPAPLLRNGVQPGDVVLGRLDVLRTLDGVEPGLFELLMLERHGARVLNPASALLAAHDKLRTARILRRMGVPHPGTVHFAGGAALPHVALPCVVKPRFGSWGMDVTLCRTSRELARCLERVGVSPWFRRHGALLQEFVPHPGRDLRVVVAGGRAVGAIERIAARGEWRTNIALGGVRRPCVASPVAIELATAAADAIGGDLVGVDLLPVDGGYVVAELNSAVEFDSAYSPPGRDIFADVATALGLPALRRSRPTGLPVIHA